jgi:hypothetical protein
MAIGRISGPLLKSNLIRDGVNLAFETDLLFLDVNNSRIGVNTASPTTDLDVNGTTRTTNLTINDQLDVGNLHITDNTISSDLSTITFSPAATNPTIYHAKLQVDDLQFTTNTISTTVTDRNLDISANGSGVINLVANTNVTGNLDVTGDVTATGNIVVGGNITIGDSTTDTITVNASITSDLVPTTTNTYDIGSPDLQWNNLYVSNVFADTANLVSLSIGQLIFNGNEINTTTGQDLYLRGAGTGGVILDNIKILGNTITNIANNAITEIAQSGTGYFKIVGTNGFVPPRGTELQRPSPSNSVLGMTRYNIVSKALEVFDGVGWSSPSGSAGAVSAQVAEDTAISFAISLG